MSRMVHPGEATQTISGDAEAPVFADADALGEGARVGRYRIESVIGVGGMGAVYRATDPDLERPVAVKILRGDPGRPPDESQQSRMLREARAVASITHPNVVTIFDFGLHEGLVYIAMECAPKTLHDWLEERPRSWRSVRTKFIAAGRGLAAAHRAGLLHRDFKPANVLLGADGRPRVADFGLALDVGEPITSQSPEMLSSEISGTARLTETGHCVGTPAFMSPEQFHGAELDPATDQFSFCVAFYRSLYGQAPFEPTGERDLAAEVMCGTPRRPIDAQVPSWIWDAIARGLRTDPAERWPSMHSLLAALDGRRRASRSVAAIAIVGVGVSAVAATGLAAGGADCTDGADAVDAIWSKAQRDAIRSRIAEPELQFAAASWTRSEAALDRFATGWAQAQAELCRSDQPAPDIDARAACLSGQLEALQSVVAASGSGDPVQLVAATLAADRLPSPKLCSDPQYAHQRVKPPSDPAIRTRLDQLRSDLAEVAALRERGRYREAAEAVAPLIATADALDYAPALAQVRLESGKLQQLIGTGRPVTDDLEAAYFLAVESGDERTQVAAAVELIRVFGRDPSDGEVDRWARRALADVERLGDHPLRADVIEATADFASRRGDHRQALERRTEALEIRERLLPSDDLRIADAQVGMGVDHMRLGEYAEALELLHAALEHQRAQLGPTHPALARTLTALGVVKNETNHQGEDVALYEEALAIVEGAYGREHPRTAPILQNLANTMMGTDPQGANQNLLRALKVQTAAYGEDNPALAGLWVATGNSFIATGMLGEAERHYREAIGLTESLGGPAPAYTLAPLSSLQWRRGEFKEAVALAERALDVMETEPNLNKIEAAKTRFRVAQLLWDDGASAQRVETLIEGVRSVFATHGHDVMIELLEAWLDERGPRGARLGPVVKSRGGGR